MAALKRPFEHCESDAVINYILCDWQVCGLCSQAVQKCLWLEPDLAYQKAVEMVLSMETAVRGSHVLSASTKAIR